MCVNASLCTFAVAQEAQPSTPLGLEEVTVTAERRSQSAQDVPISITALSADKLEAAGVDSLPQVALLTPGLQFQQIGGTSVPFLRGVGATTTAVGSEAGTALFVDGVYVAAQPRSTMSLAHVESVEVDKGPQGTLFGRNATGGVIQIATRRPTRERVLEATLGVGNYDTYEGSVYASGGVSENLAADISLYARDQSKGWGTNLFDGSDIFRSSDYGARSKWLYTPSDNTDITFIANYEQIRVESGFVTRLPAPGELGQNERSPTGAYQFNGGFYDVALNYPSFSRSRVGGVSLDWRQSFSAFDFRSISAFQRLEGTFQVDFDLSPNTGTHLRIPPTQNTISQEFQLLSRDDAQSRLKWVVGTYLWRDKAGYDAVTTTLVTQTQRLISEQITDSWAVFGQGRLELGHDTGLTLGARYTSDKRDFEGVQLNTIPTEVVVNQQQGTRTFPKPTYKIALDHRFSSDALAYIQASRGFKSGFYSTQSLQPAAVPPASTSEPLVVKPEILDAYEVGLKSEWFDNRLRANVAFFYYDYQDLQVNAFTSFGARVTLNAANAKIKGADFELQAALLPTLTASLSGAFLHARYDEFPNAPFFQPRTAAPWGSLAVPGDASGLDVVNAPDFTGTLALDYSMPLPVGDVRLNGTANYNSGYAFDPQNRLKQSSYTLLNVSAKWTSPDGRWDIALWGENLLDKEILAAANPTGGGDSLTPRPPRTYGIRLGVRF